MQKSHNYHDKKERPKGRMKERKEEMGFIKGIKEKREEAERKKKRNGGIEVIIAALNEKKAEAKTDEEIKDIDGKIELLKSCRL